MVYVVNKEQWQNADHDITLAGIKIPAARSSEWLPQKEDRIGEIYTRRSRKADPGAEPYDDYAICNGKMFEVTPVTKGGLRNIFRKERGWIQVTEQGGPEGYILVKGFRKALIPVFILLALAAFSLFLYLNTGVTPIYQPRYIADQVGITNNRDDPRTEIGSYSAYESVPDQEWTAGQTHQEIRLVLPATVTTKDKYNRDVSYKNPIDAAPHIYVDLNDDGEFSEDECVFNPMTFDKDGNVTDIGALLQAGNQIDSVELIKPVDQGEYNAQVVWTGITSDTHEMANPMTFQFHLTVR